MGSSKRMGASDNFRFKAKNGDRFYIKAHARSVASPLDPVISLYQVRGNCCIRGNDDANNGPDSLITQTFNKDAEWSSGSPTIGKGKSQTTFIESRPSVWSPNFQHPFQCMETVIPNRVKCFPSLGEPGCHFLDSDQEKLHRRS